MKQDGRVRHLCSACGMDAGTAAAASCTRRGYRVRPCTDPGALHAPHPGQPTCGWCWNSADDGWMNTGCCSTTASWEGMRGRGAQQGQRWADARGCRRAASTDTAGRCARRQAGTAAAPLCTRRSPHTRRSVHSAAQRSAARRGAAGGAPVLYPSCASLRAAWKKKPEQMAFWIFWYARPAAGSRTQSIRGDGDGAVHKEEGGGRGGRGVGVGSTQAGEPLHRRPAHNRASTHPTPGPACSGP